MRTPDTVSSDQAEQQPDPDAAMPEQVEFPRPAGNRLFFWLLIAAAFFIIDMAILFYVLRPTADKVTLVQERPVAAVPQNGSATSSLPDVKE